ncbi:MAG: helix-hairpin-helix domain-containing protein [Gemmatimonadetes bacterium]|nr:helix-hairpin-helix domain-containing protein [Gemmatimonadota bacterium]NNM04695.1 helix-hairpin-helix domain-containing protein [Gemmatimonadota bacterium]
MSKELAMEIMAFVNTHPHGWSHDEWLGFLHQLGASGMDVSDQDGVGLALERAQVERALKQSGIKGLGPKRIETIAAEFSFLPQLRDTDPAELAARTRVPRKLAQEVIAKLRS